MLIEIIGWIGTILVLGAYLLVSLKKIQSSSYTFQLMNFFGAIGLIINGFFHRAIPSVALNIIWFAIAAYALLKIFSKK